MGSYAIIRIKGTQYKVREGQELLVDYLKGQKPQPEVLLVKTEKSTKIGTPTVKGAKVTLDILEELEKGKKMHVQKFRAKSRYRKKIGFRPKYTKVLIKKITV